ncbi:MAG: cell division protein FtsL [Thermodesulfobacteriota bacterium]|nr:cell division protein FtsL [Thermodesulfobacteriota bacterium]
MSVGGSHGKENRIKTKKKSKKKISGKWFVILSFFIFELLIYTGIRLEYTNTEYRISDAMGKQKKLKSYRAELLLEKERLASPERISKIAGTRLELVVPDHNQIIYLH